MAKLPRISCPNCPRELRIRPEHIGLTVECKHCNHLFTVPRRVAFLCPECGRDGKARTEHLGMHVQCKHCSAISRLRMKAEGLQPQSRPEPAPAPPEVARERPESALSDTERGLQEARGQVGSLTDHVRVLESTREAAETEIRRLDQAVRALAAERDQSGAELLQAREQSHRNEGHADRAEALASDLELARDEAARLLADGRSLAGELDVLRARLAEAEDRVGLASAESSRREVMAADAEGRNEAARAVWDREREAIKAEAELAAQSLRVEAEVRLVQERDRAESEAQRVLARHEVMAADAEARIEAAQALWDRQREALRTEAEARIVQERERAESEAQLVLARHDDELRDREARAASLREELDGLRREFDAVSAERDAAHRLGLTLQAQRDGLSDLVRSIEAESADLSERLARAEASRSAIESERSLAVAEATAAIRAEGERLRSEANDRSGIEALRAERIAAELKAAHVRIEDLTQDLAVAQFSLDVLRPTVGVGAGSSLASRVHASPSPTASTRDQSEALAAERDQARKEVARLQSILDYLGVEGPTA